MSIEKEKIKLGSVNDKGAYGLSLVECALLIDHFPLDIYGHEQFSF